MKNADTIRASVSESYARAIRGGAASGCCGPAAPKGGRAAASGCCGPAASKTTAVGQKGATAALAGYRPEELASLPKEAAESSFGCGNPLAFAGVRPGQTVLDLGSGAGLDLLIAAERVGPTGQVIGVDMTDAMIESARENVRAAGVTNVEIRKGLIESLPVEDGSVDWVISNCVINLSPEKDRVFAEIARVLRPGGQLAISDIVTSGLPWWMRRSAALYAACVAGAISEDAYLAGLRAAGLVDVQVAERLVYDRAQLGGFLSSPETRELAGAAGYVARLPSRLINPVLGLVEGRIWSAKVTGRKPALS